MNSLFFAPARVLITFKTNVLTFSDNMDIDNEPEPSDSMDTDND